MALAGSQASLCVCRVQAFLQMALFTLFFASSGFIGDASRSLTWSQETLGELSKWEMWFPPCRKSNSPCFSHVALG